MLRKIIVAAAALHAAVSAQSIAEINGNRFLSPYNGQNVTNVKGLVTAKNRNGFWLRSTRPDSNPRTSDSIFVFNSAAARNATVGNIVTLDGLVSEYRSSAAYLYLTEITRPTNIVVVSTNNTVTPIIIGQGGLLPPSQQYSSLDGGDVFGVPNNQSRISVANPELQPTRYGLDFWESLSGELVTVQTPRAISRPNQFGDTWVVGPWRTSGNNQRGGLTITNLDANPEAILIGSPLDGTSNPTDTKLGDQLEQITGVIYQDFGFYRILPTTRVTVTSSQSPALPPPTTLESSGNCSGITVGQYNIENFFSGSSNINQLANHIANYLKSPDLLFLQEVQDNNGPTNDAIVDATVSLSALRDAINAASPRVNYSFIDIDPIDDQDGGQPGGNIRVAYLYNPAILRLHSPSNPGSSTDANEVLPGPTLKYNPGRIDPLNVAWSASRKPFAAQWDVLTNNNNQNPSSSSATATATATFFTINVHWTSKGGSTSLHGDARPPINGGVTQRTAQGNVTGTFIQQILSLDRRASILAAGDFNEFATVQPLRTFAAASGGMRSLDDVVGIPRAEQYTYLFDMNSQELDHLYVSPRFTVDRARYEHVHVNTWVDFAHQASDHDPSVARLDVCARR